MFMHGPSRRSKASTSRTARRKDFVDCWYWFDDIVWSITPNGLGCCLVSIINITDSKRRYFNIAMQVKSKQDNERNLHKKLRTPQSATCYVISIHISISFLLVWKRHHRDHRGGRRRRQGQGLQTTTTKNWVQIRANRVCVCVCECSVMQSSRRMHTRFSTEYIDHTGILVWYWFVADVFGIDVKSIQWRVIKCMHLSVCCGIDNIQTSLKLTFVKASMHTIV